MAERAPQDVLLAHVAALEAHAQSGDWEDVDRLLAGVRDRLAAVPAAGRYDATVAARNAVQAASALALEARRDVGERLTAIRQGRKAAASYRTTGALRAEA